MIKELDIEILDGLINSEEGPTLDFKVKQYRFVNASDEDKGELLKDILAFANTQRYRTAYILVGIAEVRGGRNQVVGVETHLEDASLHQFVNSKTNRPAEFSYFPWQVEDKDIGVLSIPIQTRPVYVVKKYGRLAAEKVYVRDGSSTRPASPDEIADMGRTLTPKLLEWFIQRLRNVAMHAVVVTAQQWFDHPMRRREYESPRRPQDFTQARDMILLLTESRPLEHTTFLKGIDSYQSLHWVFEVFVELATLCTQMIRITGPSLIDLGGLAQVVLEMEQRISAERNVWSEFRIRMQDSHDVLPNPANYNVLTLARQAVRFIEVLEDEEHYRNPDFGPFGPLGQGVFLKSPQWGDWKL